MLQKLLIHKYGYSILLKMAPALDYNELHQSVLSLLISLGPVWHDRSKGKILLFHLLGFYWSEKRKSMDSLRNNKTLFKASFSHAFQIVWFSYSLFAGSSDSHSFEFKQSILNLERSSASLSFSHKSMANIYDVFIEQALYLQGMRRGIAPQC